jgi:hypothetical protein
MRRLFYGVVPLLLLWAGAGAADDPKDQPKSDQAAGPAQQFQALMGEVQKAQQEIIKGYRAAKTEEGRQKAIEQMRKLPERFADRFLEFAQKHPTDAKAFDALTFVVANGKGGPETDKALDLMFQNHADKLGPLAQQLGQAESPAAEKFLRRLLESSKDHAAQAHACFSLAQMLKQRSEAAGPKPEDGQKAAKEAEELYDRVASKYADVDKLGDQAKSELFEIRNLAIGKEAPNIAGEDADGKQMKLSDYRGKVVVIDFWANW